MAGTFGPRVRHMLRLITQPRGAQIAVMLCVLAAVAALLLWLASGISDYGKNIFLNLGVELLGVLVTIFLITPVFRRLQSAQVRPHSVLDYEWYANQVAGATSTIKILDTFSHLFDLPLTRRFLTYLEEAITDRDTDVRILLLHPNSLAVSQRMTELGESVTGHTDLRREILRNLRVLQAFHRRLRRDVRFRFEVRLYTAAAGITVYRWDGKALVSFLTVGRLSGQGLQLEVTVSSPLGQFVEQRFNELWQYGSSLDEFMLLPLILVDPDNGERELTCQFIEVGEVVYACSNELLEELAHRRDGQLRAYRRDDRARTFVPELVDRRDQELLSALRAEHTEKYDKTASIFIALREVSEVLDASEGDGGRQGASLAT